MTEQKTGLVVRRGITVEAAQEVAFEVFTSRLRLWWPEDYRLGSAEVADVVLEQFEGGRWFERGVDGSECQWGAVLAWEPPDRVVLAWQVGPDWSYDPALSTEVELRFVADGPTRTRVELEHRGLEAYADRAEEMSGIFGSDGGWGGILARYAAVCAAEAS